VILVAHRTPSSASRCAHLAAAGAGVFEVDVQLRSGRLAVSHYVPLGPVGRLQRDNWRLRWHTRGRLDPALAEVDAVVPAGCRVLLDLKESAPPRRRELVDALADGLGDAPRERYLVCSPFADDLEGARSAGFATWRTVRSRSELATLLAGGPVADAAVTIRHTLLSAGVLDALRRSFAGRDGAVIAWTVNDPRRAEALRRLGIAGVTTDRTEVLHALAGDAQIE
jgi:glycerophosphoryl diester phosphodiesterase